MAMSKEHKEALARGRQEARSIKAYLNALQARKPGRPVTKESLEQRMSRVNGKLETETDALQRLDLLQAKADIEQSLLNLQTSGSLDDLVGGFVNHAKPYSERKGISYSTWREFGVPASVLREAGIAETRRRA